MGPEPMTGDLETQDDGGYLHDVDRTSEATLQADDDLIQDHGPLNGDNMAMEHALKGMTQDDQPVDGGDLTSEYNFPSQETKQRPGTSQESESGYKSPVDSNPAATPGSQLPITGSGRSDPSTASDAAANEQLGIAFEMLKEVVKPYLPLDRNRGVHEMGGIDLVNHQDPEKPSNELGVMVFAAHLIKDWEQHVADDYKAKIDSLDPQRCAANQLRCKTMTPKQLKAASKAPQPLSQPIAHAMTLPKKKAKFTKFAVVGGGMVFIKETYLRRIELENLVYRRHLDALEDDLALKVAKNLRKEITELVVAPKPAPTQAAKAASVKNTGTRNVKQQATPQKTKSASATGKPPSKNKTSVNAPAGLKRKAGPDGPESSSKRATKLAKKEDGVSVSAKATKSKEGNVIDLTRDSSEKTSAEPQAWPADVDFKRTDGTSGPGRTKSPTQDTILPPEPVPQDSSAQMTEMEIVARVADSQLAEGCVRPEPGLVSDTPGEGNKEQTVILSTIQGKTTSEATSTYALMTEDFKRASEMLTARMQQRGMK